MQQTEDLLFGVQHFHQGGQGSTEPTRDSPIHVLMNQMTYANPNHKKKLTNNTSYRLKQQSFTNMVFMWRVSGNCSFNFWLQSLYQNRYSYLSFFLRIIIFIFLFFHGYSNPATPSFGEVSRDNSFSQPELGADSNGYFSQSTSPRWIA